MDAFSTLAAAISLGILPGLLKRIMAFSYENLVGTARLELAKCSDPKSDGLAAGPRPDRVYGSGFAESTS